MQIVRILVTRKLVNVVVNGVTHALPEGTTNVNVFEAVKPFVPFTNYMLGYAGPKERGTVIVERFERFELIEMASARLNLKVLHYSEPHVVSEGGTPEDAAYWAARSARAKP